MTWASGFFDPNGNGWDITDLASILGLILTVAAVFAVVRRMIQAAASKFAREVQEIVRDELDRYTKPIQPGYRNGGESLADIAATVKQLAKAAGLEAEQH